MIYSDDDQGREFWVNVGGLGTMRQVVLARFTLLMGLVFVGVLVFG